MYTCTYMYMYMYVHVLVHVYVYIHVCALYAHKVESIVATFSLARTRSDSLLAYTVYTVYIHRLACPLSFPLLLLLSCRC